jgi:hypothetical protein
MGSNNNIRILLLLVLLVSTEVSLPPVQVDELPVQITRIQ